MRPDVLDAAIAGAGGVGPLALLSPRGRPLDQDRVRNYAMRPGITLICGRFEGVDERVLDARAIEEVSLGDFVLSGGEPAAIALIDACVRLLARRRRLCRDAGGREFRRRTARIPALYAAADAGRNGRCPRCWCRATIAHPRLAAGGRRNG